MKKILLALAVAALITPAALLSGGQTRLLTPAQKLQYAEAIIENYYVDTVASDTLVSEAIRAMLHTLDPHSEYSTPEETKELTQPLEGHFSGIGVQFNILRDTVCVIQTTAAGPSEKVGILPGDRIIYVNDTIFTHPKMDNSEVRARLRGPKGSVVNIKVKRGTSPELIDFRIVRDDIPVYSVDAAYMVTPDVGYIRVIRFAEETPKEVEKAISGLKKKGMENLILDLEDNGGGFLGAAYGLASQFLKPGQMVVYTQGNKMPPQYLRVENRGLSGMLIGAPKAADIDRLVIMVNQYSASASEIVSGAIQDNDRGLIVGRRTFGKGLVQRPFPFPDGSMIRLTTSRYYTPSGRLIQKPYKRGESEAYRLDMLTRYTSGELFSADSIHFDESLKAKTLVNGRTVYGGGGIMPDVFVPVDTSLYSTYYRDLVARGTLNRTVTDYIDAHRADIRRQYADEDAYYAGFEVPRELIDSLVAGGERDSITYDEKGLETSRPMIEGIIRGLIARDIYTNGCYMRAVNRLNPVFRRALEVITNEEEYNKYLGVKP